MRGDRSGFVLLEAVAALMIVSVTAIAVFSSIAAQLRVTARAEQLVTADELAREQLWQLETLTREELTPLADSLKSGTFAPPFDRYRWSTSVEALLGELNLYDVLVQVIWDEGKHELRTRLYRAQRRVAT